MLSERWLVGDAFIAREGVRVRDLGAAKVICIEASATIAEPIEFLCVADANGLSLLAGESDACDADHVLPKVINVFAGSRHRARAGGEHFCFSHRLVRLRYELLRIV